jgi:cell division protein FtsB
MASSAKNWEVQAKTNAVLAAAVKALEERITQLEELQPW